jgi:hypothetical protein
LQKVKRDEVVSGWPWPPCADGPCLAQPLEKMPGNKCCSRKAARILVKELGCANLIGEELMLNEYLKPLAHRVRKLMGIVIYASIVHDDKMAFPPHPDLAMKPPADF